MMNNLQSSAFVAKTTQLLSSVARLRLLLVMFLTLTVSTNVWGAEITYTHVFTTKPSIGNNTLSTITWSVEATSLNGYNNGYAGVQFGTKNTSGSITLTSANAWGEQSNTSYTGYTNVKYVYVWLNAGTGTPTATVTIGGKEASKSGTVSKNTAANGDYKQTSKLTFTPISGGNTGVIKIAASTSSKAGYIAAIEVVCETPAASCTSITPLLSYAPSSLSVGETANPTLTGNTGNGAVTYTSSNPSVATVASTGVVTANAAGTATITATIAANGDYCEGTATATIKVNKPSATIVLSEAGTENTVSGTFHKDDSYILPSSTDATCGDKVLVGWSTVEIDETDTKPTSNYYDKGTSVSLEAGINKFYAVFADQEGFDGNIDFGTQGWAAGEDLEDVGTAKFGDVISIAFLRGTNTQRGPQYIKNNNTGLFDVRIYPGNQMKITSTVAMSQINFTFSLDDGNAITSSSGTISNTIWTGNTSSVTFTVDGESGHRKIQSLEVITTGGTVFYSNYTTSCTTTYTVDYVLDGGTGGCEDARVEEGGSHTICDDIPTRTGYTFQGWKYNDTETIYNANHTFTDIQADITLVAQWNPITYSVVFDANEGTGTMDPQPFTYDVAQSLTPNTFTRDKYEFAGWNTATDGSGTSYDDAEEVENLTTSNGATITLYAQWDKLYTVTFYNIGSLLETKTQETVGGSIDCPTITAPCEGYAFVGWSETAVTNGATSYTDVSCPITPTEDIELHAVYGQGEEGGGTETVEDELTYTGIGLGIASSGNATYTTFSDKQFTSDAVYAGMINKFNSSSNPTNVIQIRSSSSNSGIVTTTSGGKAKKVVVEWHSQTTAGRTLNVYGKNSAYEAATDLYNTSTQGTLLGTIVCGTSTELTINDDYEYIGLRSNSGAMYLTSISIDWATTTAGGTTTTYYYSNPDCATEMLPSLTASVSSLEFGNVKVNQSSQKTFTLSGSNLTADATLALSGTNANMFSVTPTSVTQSSGSITNETITVTYTPTAKASHSATLTISSTDAESIEIPLSGTGVAQTANYTVKHYQQNLDDTYPAEPTYTETLSGEVGTIVTPDFNSYEGFTAPTEKKSVEITADGNAVVEYQYARDSYTLTWNLDGGTITTAGTPEGAVKYGASLTAPVVEKDGFNFKGWNPEVPNTMPAANATYTAQWKQVYTITWLVDGKSYQTGNPTTSVEDGQNITAIPSVPLLLTCAVKFMGWSIESSGSTPEDPSYYSDLFTTLDEAKVISINEDMTFHAVFATKEETVEGAGTEWVKTELSAVTEGTYALLTTDGHAFNGSISSGDGQVTTNAFSFTDNIATSAPDGTCEITFEAVSGGFKMYNANKGYLYAKDNKSGQLAWHTEETSYWYSNKYSSNNWTYDANNAVLRSYNNGSIRTYSGNTGDLLVLAKKTTSSATVFTAYITSCCETPAPTNGTYTDVAGSGSSMSVKLTWKDAANVGRYHITGENLADDVYATNYTVSGLTECETYTFYVSAFPVGGCESPKLAIEVTPYIPKTVTFVDGSTTTQKTTSCGSETVTVPNASKECYTSIWTDENGNEYSNDQTITPTEDMILTAQYTIIEYEITFKNYDGTVLQTSTIACGTKPTYGGETPTREQDEMYEYEFAGWTPTIKEADGNQIYTATYTQTQHQITVIWMVNGEEYTEGEPSNMVLAGEKVAKLPTPPSPDDYCGQVFAGWTDQPIDGAPIADAPTVLFNTPEASPTLYKEGDKTTVTFYAVFADIKE